MVVYELILWTQPCDYTERSEQRKYGLFKTPEGADRRFKEIISKDKEWYYKFKNKYEVRELIVNE
jgi:hypothetical protein